MSNIQNAIYTVVYEDGTEFNYNCKVNTDTKELFDAEQVNHEPNELDWVDQYVTLPNGKEYDVHYVEYCGDPDDVWYWFE